MECEPNHFLPRAHHVRKVGEKTKQNMGLLSAVVATMAVRGGHITHGNSFDPSSRVLVLCNSVTNRNDSFAFSPLSAAFIHCIQHIFPVCITITCN